MKKSILKTIVAGILLGAAAFYMPFFLLRTLLFIFIIGTLLRIFAKRRFSKRFGGGGFQLAITNKIRTMSDEEYAGFIQKSGKHCKRNNHGKESLSEIN